MAVPKSSRIPKLIGMLSVGEAFTLGVSALTEETFGAQR